MRNKLLVISSLLIVAAALFLITNNYELITVSAQTCGSITTPRAIQGLVSTPLQGSTSKFGTTGGCVVDPKAAFAPYKIPAFNDLKSSYFTQQRSSTVTIHELPTGDKTEADIPFTDSTDSIYHVNGNLIISANNAGTHTGIVFVEGNLRFSGNYCFGSTCPSGAVSSTVGTLFVVKGNVNIDSAVTRIDAGIIAEGIICTAFNGTSCPVSVATASQLVINGSLISIDQTDKCPPQGANCPIKFMRTLDPLQAVNNSNSPAEKVNHQVKYLVLLRNAYSDTTQKWAEVPANTTITPTFDAASSANTNPDSSTLSWSHTTAAGTNMRLIVGIALRSNTVVNSVTYGAAALTKIRSDAPGGDVRSEIWTLPNPTAGTNTITITTASSTTIEGGAVTLSNVTSLGNNAGATGSSITSSSLTVANSINNEVVIDAIALQGANASLAVSAGQTQRVKKVGTAGVLGISTKAGASPTQMGWTFSSDFYAESAVALRPY